MGRRYAAAELGITTSTLYRWLSDGFVPGEQLTQAHNGGSALTDSVLQRVKRGELRAVHVRLGRRKGPRIELPTLQEGLF